MPKTPIHYNIGSGMHSWFIQELPNNGAPSVLVNLILAVGIFDGHPAPAIP